MKKSELKNIIKECVKEVIFEEGVLSGLITEVAKGLQTTSVVQENRMSTIVEASKKRNSSTQDQTKKAIDLANSLIVQHEKTVETIHTKLDDVPKMLTPVGNVIQTINKEREQTEKTLDVLSKLREDAENAIPSLQTNLKKLTNTLSNDIADVSGKLQKLDNEMTNELEKAIEVMGAHLGSLSEQLVKDYQPLVTSLRSLIELANRSKTSR